MTLEEAGNAMGCSREKIRQLEAATIKLLRSPRYASILQN